MVKLLAKLFIKETEPAKMRGAYGTLCSVLGIALNLVLFGIKFFAGTVSGAISVTADAFNNLSDSGSSLITLCGFRLAAKKPDPTHPFGHGRVEYLSGLAVSALILLMGYNLLTESISKIKNPVSLELKPVVFVILGISVFVKLYMFSYNRSYGKKFNSAAMIATAGDSVSDAVSTGAVLAAMTAAYFTNLNIDAWAGLVVSLFILWTGIKSAYETVQPLLGQPPEKEFVDSIGKIVLESELVTGVHDLVVHDYGPGRQMISIHAEVPANRDIMEIHDEIDNIEMRLFETLGCMATIHMDPINTDDAEVSAARELTEKCCAEIDKIIRFHDFRMVKGETHTNYIFDVVVPFKYSIPDEELKKKIAAEIKAKNPSVRCVITVDKDYSGQI